MSIYVKYFKSEKQKIENKINKQERERECVTFYHVKHYESPIVHEKVESFEFVFVICI